jgi:glycosyltransferase involved in cell wall biosynthesis
MVSVIIPCHNCANFIDRAVSSVMAQTYSDIEIILVNNNSTDNSLRILNYYQNKYPNHISVYNEYKRGAPAARNCGLKQAKGNWVQFLDADDELLEDKISRQLQLAMCSDADVVAGSCLLKYTRHPKTYDVLRYVDDDVWRGLITSNLGITSSNLWRKASLLKVNGWNEKLTSSQEYDLLFRMIKNDAKVITDILSNTIVHFSNNSVSKTSNKERLEEILSNRIELRMAIKEELLSQHLLTPELTLAIDPYIYTELVKNADKVKEYATSLLKKYNPNVKFETVIKLKSEIYLKKLLKTVKAYRPVI